MDRRGPRNPGKFWREIPDDAVVRAIPHVVFKARYRFKGLYLLDEPETALSPGSQLELLRLLKKFGAAGHAQFIIASHSPILLACPGATIYNFDDIPIKKIAYRETAHYRIFREFMADPDKFM